MHLRNETAQRTKDVGHLAGLGNLSTWNGLHIASGAFRRRDKWFPSVPAVGAACEERLLLLLLLLLYDSGEPIWLIQRRTYKLKEYKEDRSRDRGCSSRTVKRVECRTTRALRQDCSACWDSNFKVMIKHNGWPHTHWCVVNTQLTSFWDCLPIDCLFWFMNFLD